MPPIQPIQQREQIRVLEPVRHLPMSRREMDDLGWETCDVIIVTGDAYVDHPSFGMAVMGRVLEAQGFRVGIIAQPDWQSAEPFRALGRPELFFGVTSGNMDSMVNRYTAEKRLRSDDGYTPGGQGGARPDRAALVYAQRCREAYKGVPVVLGGIEASLRRIAHYDYWSDKVRRSILPDSKADLLVYGNGERQILEIAHRLARGEEIGDLRDIRGTAYMVNRVPAGFVERDSSEVDTPGELIRHPDPYADAPDCPPEPGLEKPEAVQLQELRMPAWEMIRFSVNIMRGCFGGCTFCSITEHEGRIIQSRSRSVHPQRDGRDPRPHARLHRHHLRPRRTHRQHVAAGLQGPEDRVRLPAPSCVYPTSAAT
jgi:radical SAM superfamily enzyme YgiQ (UPF0313 family)